jgi:hypothetical protein
MSLVVPFEESPPGQAIIACKLRSGGCESAVEMGIIGHMSRCASLVTPVGFVGVAHYMTARMTNLPSKDSITVRQGLLFEKETSDSMNLP